MNVATNTKFRLRWLPTLIAVTLLTACTKTPEPTEKDVHGNENEIVEKGPHGGRLLVQDGFSIEVTIFERGVPPEFRVFAYDTKRQLKPSEVQVTIELTRFGGRVDRFSFVAKDDYLLGSAEVEEPHSFNVLVQAQYKGKPYKWTYESFEGRTAIVNEMSKSAGVAVATAGPGTLRERITLSGAIQPDPARLRSVTARYPGVIQSVAKNIGDRVSTGETLAIVESNESLQKYTVTAPIAGTITLRHANAGETAGSEPLFEIADFTTVRAELSVFPRDFARLRKGQAVLIRAADSKLATEGRLTYLATSGSASNQSLLAQVVLDNKQGTWTPGLFVSADVVVGEISVPVAIPMSALQKFRDWDVVFLNQDEAYQAQPLELGRNDGETVEVLSGLAKGDQYVVTNSYLIKADIEKSGASHDH